MDHLKNIATQYDNVIGKLAKRQFPASRPFQTTIHFLRQTTVNAPSDVLRKTHQPGLFFTHPKNAASQKILHLTEFYTANYAGLNKPLSSQCPIAGFELTNVAKNVKLKTICKQPSINFTVQPPTRYQLSPFVHQEVAYYVSPRPRNSADGIFSKMFKRFRQQVNSVGSRKRVIRDCWVRFWTVGMGHVKSTCIFIVN